MRLVLTILIALSTCAALAADESRELQKCQSMRQQMADEHFAKAAEIEAEHQIEIADLAQRFENVVSTGGDDGAYVQRIVDRVVNRHQLHDRHNHFVKKVIDKIIDGSFWFDNGKGCARKRDYRRLSESYIDEYASELTHARDEINSWIDIQTTSDSEGLVAIAFNSTGHAETIWINKTGSLAGSIIFGPVANELYFRVVKLSAGRYELERISHKIQSRQYYFEFGDRKLDFDVIPGKLNIVGFYEFERSGAYADVHLHDRSGMVMKLLEDRYPELIGQFEIVNNLKSGDRFIDYYLDQKSRHSEPLADVE